MWLRWFARAGAVTLDSRVVVSLKLFYDFGVCVACRAACYSCLDLIAWLCVLYEDDTAIYPAYSVA